MMAVFPETENDLVDAMDDKVLNWNATSSESKPFPVVDKLIQK
jgi:hypothetical protein